MDINKKRKKSKTHSGKRGRKKKHRTKRKKSKSVSRSYVPSEIRNRKELKKKDKSKGLSRSILIFLISFFFATVICLTVFLTLFEFRFVNEEAMSPSLAKGDMAIISKHGIPRRNNIVVFKGSKGMVFARVIGIPNDTLMYQEGKLVINGVERLQPYVTLDNQLATEDFTVETPIPEQTYYVLGDNRASAVDSRTMGLIKKQQIIGVLETVIIPQK